MKPSWGRVPRVFLTLPAVLALAPAAPLAAHSCVAPNTWHGVPNVTPADFTPPVGVVGVWRPGSGQAFLPETGLAEADLACFTGQPQPCLVDNFGDGRAIADFERYEVAGSVYYALVFAAGEKRETLLPRLYDETDLQQELIYQQTMDKHLVDFEAYAENGVRRWAGLFQEGVAYQELALSMTGAQLETRVATPEPRMRRLIDFEVLLLAAGYNRYAALFDDQPADQIFFASLSAEEFHTQSHLLQSLRYRLRDVESWIESPPSGALRFAALFERALGDDHLFALACNRNIVSCSNGIDFAHMEETLLDRTLELGQTKPGLRLIDIEFPQGVAQLGGFSSLTGGQPAPAARATRRGSAAFGDDPPWIGNPPHDHCNHAGVLHDAGTNGPP